ncbi:SipW-dependent-type signal peptide-containing protein [Clostridium tarantellae]|uniref:Uncharacterized protein n=1 Tax=Clostridium tarantellae TaxID=39493 RepID=A0A6I1MN58_9CLOT|nr:SipW-dependent-type signal peptide-containing protein [Clostridium tarantellae]MPQ44400.1 hypothetical protein [Clostridium tarantellae]
MKLKNKLIAMMTGLALAFTGATGSYAYFTDRATSKDNSISIGEFPEATMNVYSSIGPMYSGMIKTDDGFESKATVNYEKWLNNASQYITNYFNKEKVNIDENVDEKQRFQLIENNNNKLVSRKALIGTVGEGNYSWMGSKNNAGEEYGAAIHHIVAISNGAHNGADIGKLNYKHQKLNIDQNHILKNLNKNKEYLITENSNENIILNSKEERTRTFNWDETQGKYVQVGQHKEPSEEADLIIFDIASRGYYTKNSTESSLNNLIDKISANSRHWQLDFSPTGEIIYKILWEENSPMYPLVQQLVNEKEFYAGIVRNELQINYVYDYAGESSTITKKITLNIGEDDPKEEFNPDNNVTFSEELESLKSKLLNEKEKSSLDDNTELKDINNKDINNNVSENVNKDIDNSNVKNENILDSSDEVK